MAKNVIQRLKLSITTNCNFRCNYCFVNKHSAEMPFSIARNSVEQLFLSKKYEKRSLCIYGGEPFLYPRLLEKIVRYARIRSSSLGKSLKISCCSNGLLLDKSMLRFFRKREVFLNISMFASKNEHDKSRLSSTGRGTFDRVIMNLRLAQQVLPKRLLSVSLCIYPRNTAGLKDQIYHIRNSFDIHNFNFELIKASHPRWTDNSVAQFSDSFKVVLKELIRGIKAGKPFFIGALSRELSMSQASSLSRSFGNKASFCPKKFCLEVYPDGQMAFSPFLQNARDRYKYLLGNIQCFGESKIANCNFAPSSSVCRNCAEFYFTNVKSRPYEALLDKQYNDIVVKTARLIRHYAKSEFKFRRYITQAREGAY